MPRERRAGTQARGSPARFPVPALEKRFLIAPAAAGAAGRALCSPRFGFRPGPLGLVWEGVFGNGPETQPSGSHTLPPHPGFISGVDFSPLLIFSLKKWFPSLVAWLSL